MERSKGIDILQKGEQTMTTQITSAPTKGQTKQIKRFFDDAIDRMINEALIDKPIAQKFIENGDELFDKLVGVFEELGGSSSTEERSSKYGHPNGFKPSTIKEHKLYWKQQFPDLDSSHVDELAKALPHKKGWIKIAVPKPSKLGSDYEAPAKILGLIKKQRDFYNYCEGKLDPAHLRVSQKTKAIIDRLEVETPGDFLVLLINDTKFIGFSVEDARNKFEKGEFGLDLYLGACYILLNKDRLCGVDEESFIDLPSAEYSPFADGDFSCALYFDFDGGQLKLYYSRLVSFAFDSYGSASAFAP